MKTDKSVSNAYRFVHPYILLFYICIIDAILFEIYQKYCTQSLIYCMLMYIYSVCATTCANE